MMQEYKEEYYNGRERMNPTIENKIKNNTTDISKNPAFPSVDKDGNPINFIELLAYKRFLDVVKKVKHYTGLQDVSGENGFMRLQTKFAESLMKVFAIEKQHRPYLEKLGVDLITEEMELPKNAFKFNAKIVDMGTVSKDGFQVESKEPSKEQIDNEFKEQAQDVEMTPMQVFELEKEKRRFINLLIQGASKKGHYMYELRRAELNTLHPELANLYGMIMSINDLTYWIMPENMLEQMAKNPQAVGGKEEIEEENGETKIKTQAVCFPYSVHENIKGVMEVFGTHGLPDSKEAQEMIFNSTDTLLNETWDVRLGVVVWEKFLSKYPMEVFEQGQKYIQHFIFSRFCALDSDEFFEVSKQILSNNPKGEKFIQDMVTDIVREVKKSDLDSVLGNYDYDDEDSDSYFKKGGNVSSIEKRVKEINNLIELANANNLQVVDESGSWQSPMKYQPIKYSNGVLYIEYDELDLYSHLKRGSSQWKRVKEKVLKRDVQFDNPLNQIAKMYRKALKNADIQFSDGGMTGLSDVSTMLPNPLPMSTIQAMADGGNVSDEVDYVNRRIKNLEQLLSTVNEDEKDEIRESIQQLQKERDGLLKKGDNPISMPRKKFFGFAFQEGGETVGEAHEKHEASETEEEERAEHEYDVYDNKRMLENQANEIEHHSEELNNQLPSTKKVPAWVISKMERATTDLSDITHYLDGENKMADGGSVGADRYDVVPFRDKFAIVKVSANDEGYLYPSKDVIRDFNGDIMKFDDINSAQNFINNIEPKYPFGIPKANAGMMLLASQFLQPQQQAQPQVVYYVPQQQEESTDAGIVQNIPQMAFGGETSDLNDFCITNVIGLAGDLQPLRYYTTSRYDDKDFESKKYKGKVVIVFKEPVKTAVVNAINEFIEKADDCHEIFEQSVNISVNEPNSISVYLLTDKFTDREYKKGGKVYEYPPKKINLSKTKKITTELGDYSLGLITNDFVYFVNPNEGDENAQTIMYNKKGELVSDNVHATNELFSTLETEDSFEFIHPDIEAYRQEIING